MIRLLASGAMALALTLSACTDPSDVAPAAGTANDSVTTPVERPAEAVEVDPFAAEPGIDGGTSPLSVFAIGPSDCYVYERAVVLLTRGETEDGDVDRDARPSVSLIDRTPGATPRDDCDREPTLDLSAALGGVDRFVSIEDSLVIAVQRTGPTVFVHDIASAETVLEEAYTEPLAVADGGLLFGAPATPMASQEALDEAGVVCPEAAEVFARDGAVGASIRMRFDFETRETTATEEIVCVETDA